MGNITFYSNTDKDAVEILRISVDGITANPNVQIDDAAKAVLSALDYQIKQMFDLYIQEKNK